MKIDHLLFLVLILIGLSVDVVRSQEAPSSYRVFISFVRRERSHPTDFLSCLIRGQLGQLCPRIHLPIVVR